MFFTKWLEERSARMLVLPQDIVGYYRKDGTPYTADGLSLVEAVRMSMSYPFLFTPHVLYDREKKPHYVVDGGLLSNFPVWLFDRRDGKPSVRPNVGVSPSPRIERRACRAVPRTTDAVLAARARPGDVLGRRHRLGRAAGGGFRRRADDQHPTFDVATTDFRLSKENGARLYESGVTSTQKFFELPATREYLEQFAAR